jgi:hypothetical protein
MNLSFLFGILKFNSSLIIGTFLCASVIASTESTSVYVRTRLGITLKQLSLQLEIPSDYLADLNDCDVNRKFSNNEWVAIPARLLNNIRFVVALDDSEIRRTQPNRMRAQLPPPGGTPAPLNFDKSLEELLREGKFTIKESQQLQRGKYNMPQRIVPNLSKLCSSGVLSPTECAKSKGLFQSHESTRKVKGICSELDMHQIEVNTSPNPSIQRLMALQRRNASRDACNVEKVESDRLYQAERIAELRRNRLNWKNYGDVQIPWGLWFEPLAGKRVNGFLGSSNSLLSWGRSIESYGPTGAPNGISVSCSTGTFSINTNPNWNRVQSGWTKWAAPARDSNWERIVIDLCSPVVNR